MRQLICLVGFLSTFQLASAAAKETCPEYKESFEDVLSLHAEEFELYFTNLRIGDPQFGRESISGGGSVPVNRSGLFWLEDYKDPIGMVGREASLVISQGKEELYRATVEIGISTDCRPYVIHYVPVFSNPYPQVSLVVSVEFESDVRFAREFRPPILSIVVGNAAEGDDSGGGNSARGPSTEVSGEMQGLPKSNPSTPAATSTATSKGFGAKGCGVMGAKSSFEMIFAFLSVFLFILIFRRRLSTVQ